MEDLLDVEYVLVEVLKHKLVQHETKLQLEDARARTSNIDDLMFRFYTQSPKSYKLQDATLSMVRALMDLLPNRPPCARFLEIIGEGTNKEFHLSHNEDWNEHVRPILEAFFHARFFLEKAIYCSASLEDNNVIMGSEWSALKTLFDL